MIDLHPKYKPLFTALSRYFICTGGRGSSKSFSITTWAVLLLFFERGHTILFTRYTLVSAHISIIPEFKAKLDKLGITEHFDITKDSITCNITGSKVLFRGIKTSSGNQTANLKSIEGVTCWILEEAEELTDETIFDTINLSVRQAGIENRVILIMNPTTKEHFVYKRFFEDMGVQDGSNTTKDGVTYIHTTYLDNITNLDASFIAEAEALRLRNPEKYKHVMLGGWLNKAEGVVITNWKLGQFNPNGLQTIFGQDYGFSIDPTTLVEVAIDKTKKIIYVKEHLYKKGLTTSEIFNINKSVAGQNLIIGDSSEPRLIEELRQLGNNIIEAHKPQGSVSAGIAYLQDYLIVVDPDSTNIVKEFNNYVYSNKKASLFVDAFNHLIDPIRYVAFLQLSTGHGTYNF